MIVKLFNKLFRIEEWIVAYTKASNKIFFETKGKILKKHITIINGLFNFFADPFLIKIKKNKAFLFVENYSFFRGGRISFLEINLKDNSYKEKIILSGGHYSFPFFLKKKSKFILFPEMSYKKYNNYYVLYNNQIIKKKNFFNYFNLIDPIILKYKNFFWLFCSKKDINEDSNLYIFYSKDLHNWENIKYNPVIINNINNCRSAGNIIKYKNILYRPAQNSNLNYGRSLNINKIQILSKYKFKEKKFFSIQPLNTDSFNKGIHHISLKNNYIFFDKKRYKYTPFKLIYKIF
jgi:hypothetical protein